MQSILSPLNYILIDQWWCWSVSGVWCDELLADDDPPDRSAEPCDDPPDDPNDAFNTKLVTPPTIDDTTWVMKPKISAELPPYRWKK